MPSPIPPEHRRSDVRYATAADVAGVVAVPKDEPLRSESYRRYVALQECFGCGVHGWSQCAHENAGKGMAQKTCDSRTFPLCGARYGLLGCHQQYDIGIEMMRDEKRAMAAEYVEKMQARAKDDGWNLETLKRK